MTMFSRSQVINNLREERKKLKDKLEAVKGWLDRTKSLSNDEEFPWFELLELEKILEAEG